MSREKFEADFQKGSKELKSKLQDEYIEKATKMDVKRDNLIARKEKIEKEIAEIEGKPEASKEIAEDSLSFDRFKDWLKENGLAEKITVIEEQLNDWEKLYDDVGSEKLDRSKFLIEKDRLLGIKKGFEVDCLNFAMPMPVAENLTEKEKQMNEALYVHHKLVEPLKTKRGFKFWDEAGEERWTGQNLLDHLASCNPVEPEEIDAEAFKKDWVAEEIRVLDQKGAPPKIKAGSMRLVFTDNRLDVPKNQTIVNKKGEVVAPEDSSHIETIVNNIRVLSRAEKMALASYVFWKTGKYLSSETWEFERDFVDHHDKNTNPPVSVAGSRSSDGGLSLGSGSAVRSDGRYRRRVSL